MQIIDGLNYTHKIENMIQECTQQAKLNPFEHYLFITEYPDIVEQLFFQYTDCLVNIEIMTWQKYLKRLMIEHHLTAHHVISHTELTYILRYILKNHSFTCFTNRQPYPLIQKFIPLLKDYDIYEVDYQEDTFDHPKLTDFIRLYHLVKEQCDAYTHLCLESVFDSCSLKSDHKNHIYIDGDHLYQQKRQNIIKRLSQYHDITVLYTYQHDKRLLNVPYQTLCQNAIHDLSTTFLTNNLFLQAPQKNKEESKLYTFVSPSLHQEVKRVIYTIYQKIVDENLHYSDFMIVYPDSTYTDLLMDTLSSLHIPHNLPSISSCTYDYSYQTILKQLNDINQQTISDIAHALYNDELDHEYLQYLESLFDYHDDISKEEFKDFFIATYSHHHQESYHHQDHISICTIDNVRVSKAQHIFFLGMNETVFPRLIKDTSLLLDEDIETLRQQSVTTPLTTLEQLGVHHNDILKALNQPHLSMTFSYPTASLSGETLLASSLYKQLQSMYTLIPLSQHQFLPLDDYYLKGGIAPSQETLNQYIQTYLQSKNQPQKISFELIQKLYSPTLSVSQIESYNKCPFMYFIQYGLGIYPIKEKKLLPNELGSLIHYILSMNLSLDQNIDELVNDYIQKDQNLYEKITSSYINQYFIDQLKKDLHITLTVLNHYLNVSSFTVHSQEKKIQGQINHLDFKGFVDRIDEYQNYISIIDYKSSSKDIDLNLAMQGFNIQMLLYLKMVTQKYHKDPGAVLYFNTKKRILSSESLSNPIDEKEFYKQYRYGGYIIDDEAHQVISAIDPYIEKKSDIINVTYVKSKNEYKGHILTQQQLHSLFTIIEEHIGQLYQQMCDGHIAIMPKGSDQNTTHTMVNPCRYCPYHSICSFDVFYNDYELVQFYDVKTMLGGEEDAV